MGKLQHPAQSPRYYDTGEVASILQTSEFRVRSFSAPAYGLDKQVKAPGSGHRKRYSFEVVLKLAVADELYGAHISPAGIKTVLELIEKQKSVRHWIDSVGQSVPSMVLALDSKRVTIVEDGKQITRIERVWKVLSAEQANSVATGEIERGSVAVTLDLMRLWEGIVQRITDLEAAKEI